MSDDPKDPTNTEPDNRPDEDHAAPPEEEAEEKNPEFRAKVDMSSERVRELSEKAREAFRSGTSDAMEALEKNFPRAKEEFAKGINDASYAIGYAISFGSTMLREFSPDNVNEGFERGSQAGNKAAEEVIEHRRGCATTHNASPPEDEGEEEPEPTTPS